MNTFIAERRPHGSNRLVRRYAAQACRGEQEKKLQKSQSNMYMFGLAFSMIRGQDASVLPGYDFPGLAKAENTPKEI